jgi:hypothetical protein
VGNFIEVIMTRSFIAKTLIMASCYFLIPFLLAVFVPKLTAQNKAQQPLFFLIANFMMVTMGLAMWRQTYGWVAGFANFGLSAVLMLLNLMQLLPVLENEPAPKHSLFKSGLFFLLTVAGQLFLENLAFFMVVVTVAANIYYFKKHKAVHSTYCAMAIGSILGFVIMFSSSIYGSMLDTGTAVEGYRSLSFSLSDSFGKILYNIFYQVMCLAQRGGQFRCAAIVILALLGITAFTLNAQNKTRYAVINGILALYFLTADLLPQTGAVWILLGGGMSFLFYGCIAAEVFFLFRKQTAVRTRLLLLFACAFFTILPLAATGENGPRVFLPFYVLFVLFILVLASEVSKHLSQKEKKYLFPSLLCVTAAIILVLTWCYTQIGICTAQRYTLIKEAISREQSSVTLPRYPYEDLLWKPDAGEERMQYFKDFYKIPEHITVIFETNEN